MLLLTRRNLIPLKSIIAKPLSVFATRFHSTQPNPLQNFPHDEETQDHQVEELEPISISNTSHWSRKIHDLCNKHGRVDEALRLLESLRLRGYHPDSLNLSSIVHGLCLDNRYKEAHHRFAMFLDSGCIPDERTCNVIMARFLYSGCPADSLNVLWRLVDAKPEFVPSLVNYNRLIYQFCEVSLPGVGHRLFFDMVSRGHRPNVVSFTTLIDGYCKIGEVGLAYKVFDEMTEYGRVVPNSLTYSVLIRGVLRRREVEKGRELVSLLWKRMKEEEDQSVNAAAFANLIDSLCREGFYNEVFDIAEGMPQGKSVDEVFAYGQMIDSLCRVGRSHGASRVVYMMRKRGFVPSQVSYNSIIHRLCKERGYMRAFQLLKEGIEFGYMPSEYTYNVLLGGLCEEIDICKAKEVLEIMLNKPGVDKTRIYNIYLRALRQLNNPTELLNVVVTMLQTNCQPDVFTLNTVINGFCKAQRLDEALKVLNDMISGRFCAPDVVTFTTIISGLLAAGRNHEALQLLHEVMHRIGVRPNVVTYNAVLHGLFRLKLSNDAMAMFEQMIIDLVDADSTTYSIVISGLCESDQIERAKSFWTDVVWPSKIHDNFVYAAILKGLCRCGKLNEACDFLYELVDFGVTLNTVSYNIVIDAACKLGMAREAYQMMREMRKNGLEPDAITWRILDKLHVSLENDCGLGLSNHQS